MQVRRCVPRAGHAVRLSLLQRAVPERQRSSTLRDFGWGSQVGPGEAGAGAGGFEMEDHQ